MPKMSRKAGEEASANTSPDSSTQRSGTRTYLKAHERELQILRRAIELFVKHGFAVSTRDIAKHCGITQSLLYRYFPNKQAIFDRLYKEIYVARWKPEWEDMVLDRGTPIEARLNEYLRDYLQIVLQSDWVRLFLFGALEDPIMNQRYLAMLRERIHIPILNEVRFENGLPPATDSELELQLDVVWGFHSSFFYLGVRRWVYEMPLPGDLDAVVAIRVKAFLAGMKEILAKR